MADIQLNDFQPGQRYYVQVRAKSKYDPNKVSEWSKVFSFTTSSDTVAPAPVADLVLTSEGSAFVAKWTAPTTNSDGTPLKDLHGYWIRFKNTDDAAQQTREIFTADTNFTLDFESNRSLFGTARGNVTVEVKAVDQIGNRSTAVSTTASNPRPADVASVEVTEALESLAINWTKVDDIDLVGYEVHVSTTGAAFVPSPSTLKYFGPGTSFVLPTSNPVPHYVKVRAVDIFGLTSAVDATDSGTPRTSTSTDTVPPADPTNVAASSAVDGDTVNMTVTWNAVADNDLNHYVVRYGRSTTQWSYVNVDNESTSVVIPNVKPGTEYYVGVKAVDHSNNSSAWVNAATYPITTIADTTPPAKPAVPTVSTSVGKALVSHNLKDSSNANLAADTAYIEIHLSNASGFTPSATTFVDSMPVTAPGVPVSLLVAYLPDDNDTIYWKVVAVDEAGNKSVASNEVTGTPGLIENAYIADATINDAKINSLSAAKLVAGTAFVNNLFIRSKLTIDNANGSVESDDFSDTNRTGWRINRDGITINEGTIRAKALEIQEGVNLVPPQYALFEFNNEFYFDANNDPSSALTATAGTKLYKKTDGRIGKSSLNIKHNGAANNRVFLRPSSGGYNIPVDGGSSYIYSVYVRNNRATAFNFEIGFVFSDGTFYAGPFLIQPGNTWTRVVIAAPAAANVTSAYLSVGTTDTDAVDYDIDGLQFERQMGANGNASPWKSPGGTSINGSSIVTGSIRSSAPAVGIPTQPAWSLNTQGNLQVGDALVRGSLVVGAGADTSNSAVKSSDYLAGSSGWIIKGDGSAEFNNGTFRGDLNIVRSVNSLVTNLKASVINQKMYTSGGTASEININTPGISGQHYQYDRSVTADGGWYLPTVANANKPMKYFFGPTTERTLIMQIQNSTNDSVITGSMSSYPPNIPITNIKLGDYVDYKQVAYEKEIVGFRLETSMIEKTGIDTDGITYTWTRNDVSGNIYRPTYINQNVLDDRGFIRQVSPFAPEYITSSDNGSLTNSYAVGSGLQNQNTQGERVFGVRTANNTFQKNLLTSPYCDTFHSTYTFDGTANYNELTGTGAQQVTTTGTAGNIGVTASLEYGMHADANYKTPSYLVNWSVSSNSQSILYLTNKMSGSDPSTWNYYVHSIRRGKRYILSVYIRTDLPGSTVSGQQGPPAAAFNLTMGLRCRTSGTSPGYIDVERAVVVDPGKSTRVSVAIDIPTGTPELNSAIMYFKFPGQSLLNRQVAITHPQVEEKVWSIHPNPKIANSNAPTAWTNGSFGIESEAEASIRAVSKATTDMRYDAYGRSVRLNKVFNDTNRYEVVDYGAYRESPAYIDLMLTNKMIRTGGNAVDDNNRKSIFRFSEAGLQFPASFEPYMPAGVQAFFSTRYLPAGTAAPAGDKFLNLTEHQYNTGEVFVGSDVRRYTTTTSYIVDRAGFYVMYAKALIISSGPDAIWWNWKVTNKDGTFDIAKGAVGRANTWETDNMIMRYLNRDDIVTPYLVSAASNAAGHDINDIMICIARVN